MLALELLIYLIIILFIIYLMWNYRKIYRFEGFYDTDLQPKYDDLTKRLSSMFAGYCKLTDFAQKTMKEGHMATSNGSEADAMVFIQKTYRDIYACRDELAKSRAPCIKVPGEFLPCTTYTNLPEWSESDQDSMAIALSNIPDNLPAKIMAESAYYKIGIQKLQEGIDTANDPPSTPPDSASTPATNSSGKPWSIGEGFEDAKCSPAAAQALRERMRRSALDKEAGECTIPSVDSEITRVSALLDSDSMIRALSTIDNIYSSMLKVQADIEEIKKKWGDDGPKKSYEKFGGGDRIKSLLFSMKQA